MTIPQSKRQVSSRRAPRKVSIVVATYKSAQFIGELVSRLKAVFENREEALEIILVDDGSPDATWETILELHEANKETVKIVKLLRNAGQHNALLCGFGLVTGDVVVTMDDDLQHPPEEVPKLLEKLAEGDDLVIGAYDDKKHERYRSLAGGLVDGLIRHIYGLDSKLELTSFRAMRRPLVDLAYQARSPFPYITCMLLDHAARVSNTRVIHVERRQGTSAYSLKRSFILAANLIISYSSLPLYITAFFCLIAGLFTTVICGWVLALALSHNVNVPGWASALVVLTLFATFTLLSLFVMGIYIARIHHQIVGRSVPYTIDERYD